MRHKLLSLDCCSDRDVAALTTASSHDNKKDIARMKSLLSKAINVNLTERQRECVTLYYIENKKMTDVAVELNLDKSTVSRHLSSARKKLKSLNALI